MTLETLSSAWKRKNGIRKFCDSILKDSVSQCSESGFARFWRVLVQGLAKRKLIWIVGVALWLTLGPLLSSLPKESEVLSRSSGLVQELSLPSGQLEESRSGIRYGDNGTPN